jgi:hypothetical protein
VGPEFLDEEVRQATFRTPAARSRERPRVFLASQRLEPDINVMD